MEAKVKNGLLNRRRKRRSRRRRRERWKENKKNKSDRLFDVFWLLIKVLKKSLIEYSLFVYLKMELVGVTETSLDFCHIARCLIPWDGTLLSCQLQVTVTAICRHIIICHENMSGFLPYPLYLSFKSCKSQWRLCFVCVSLLIFWYKLFWGR